MKYKSIYQKISKPLYLGLLLIIIIFFAIFGILATDIVIKNVKDTVKSEYNVVHNNLIYQFNNIYSYLSILQMDNDIETSMEAPVSSNESYTYAAPLIALNSKLSQISLFPVSVELAGKQTMQVSYTTSVILEDTSALYDLAIENFDGFDGVYKNIHVKDLAWYQNLRSGISRFESWSDTTSANSRVMYFATNKISRKTGAFLGVIVIGLDTVYINEMLHGTDMYPGSLFLLLDRDGQTINTLPENEHGAYTDAALKADNTIDIQLIHKTPSFTTSGNFSNNWRLSLIVPLSSIWVTITLYLIFLALIIFLTIMTVRVFLHKYIHAFTSPIEELSKIMEDISMGNFDKTYQTDTDIEELVRLYDGYNFMIHKIQELIKSAYENELEKQHYQLYSLQMQINPHFLYNSLDMISCMAMTNHTDKITGFVQNLAAFFRYGLNNGKCFHTVSDELEEVLSYFDIQKMMNDSLYTEYYIDPDTENAYILNLTIQPFIENAVLHAFKNQLDNCRIRVEILRCAASSSIQIKIIDNGCGVDVKKMNDAIADNQSVKKNHIGIINVHRRIRVYFGNGWGVQYLPANTGTCVLITLPYISEPPLE